jgi:hypothetical protein
MRAMLTLSLVVFGALLLWVAVAFNLLIRDRTISCRGSRTS